MVFHQTIKRFSFLAAALLLCCLWSVEGTAAGEGSGLTTQDIPVIRMVVSRNIKDSTLGVDGTFCVLDDERVSCLEGENLSNTKVSCVDGKIQFGKKEIPGKRVLLKASHGSVQVQNRSYGSNLEIVPDASDRLTLVSLLDLEDYTLGVLQKEMEPTWPLEVLKAQAVLIRTNAIYAYIKNKDKLFHVTANSPQVFQYCLVRNGNAPAAVDETRGLILMYNDRVIPAYFHSVCGGSTESAQNVWNWNQPYSAFVLCKYCKGAPKYCWVQRMGLEEFQDKLTAAGLPIAQVRDVFASKVSAVSDRITEIIVEHDAGKTVLRTNTLRSILGHDKIRSTSFSVELQGHRIVFKGYGWGHGVGLCQWGARAMARSGVDFEDILKFYYPGVTLVRVKE